MDIIKTIKCLKWQDIISITVAIVCLCGCIYTIHQYYSNGVTLWLIPITAITAVILLGLTSKKYIRVDYVGGGFGGGFSVYALCLVIALPFATEIGTQNLILLLNYTMLFSIGACIYTYLKGFSHLRLVETKKFISHPIKFTKAYMKSRYNRGLLFEWIKNRTRELWMPYVICMLFAFLTYNPEFRASVIELSMSFVQIAKDINTAMETDYKVSFIFGILAGVSLLFLAKKDLLLFAMIACACLIIFTGCNDDRQQEEGNDQAQIEEEMRGRAKEEESFMRQHAEKIVKEIEATEKINKNFYRSADVENAFFEAGKAEKQLIVLEKTIMEIMENCQFSVEKYNEKLDKRSYSSKHEFYYNDEERAKIEGKKEVCMQLIEMINEAESKNRIIAKMR